MNKSNNRKKAKVIDTPWLGGREGAEYSGDGYRPFMDKMNRGLIRSVKDGRKRKTRKDWIDDYLFSKEEIGMLERR